MPPKAQASIIEHIEQVRVYSTSEVMDDFPYPLPSPFLAESGFEINHSGDILAMKSGGYGPV